MVGRAAVLVAVAVAVVAMCVGPVGCEEAAKEKEKEEGFVLDDDTLLMAVGLAKFSYTKNPNSIPKMVRVAGVPQTMQRPLLVFEDGLHAYLFREAAGRRRFVVALRGTELGNLRDFAEDFRWFGSSTHPHISPSTVSLHRLHPTLAHHRQSFNKLSSIHPSSSDLWAFASGDYNYAHLTYLALAVRMVGKVCAYVEGVMGERVEPSQFLFVGHSLGAAVASLLAVAYDAHAIVFNSPGTLLAAWRACEQLGTHRDLHVPPDVVQRLCHAAPNTPSVFNVYFEADVLPFVLDYQLGHVCEIGLSDVASHIESFQEEISKIRLGHVLNINFPEGIISCEDFGEVRRFSEFFRWSFLECFGAAHHVQVVYKMLQSVPNLPSTVRSHCLPFFTTTNTSTTTEEPDQDRSVTRLIRMFPALLAEYRSSAWTGGLGVLWRGRVHVNLFAASTKLFRLVRHTPLLIVVLVFPGWWARRVRKKRWRQRVLRDRISIILVSVKSPLIGVRILRETTLSNLFFGDQITINLIMSAAKRTTPDAPILADPITKEDYWMIKNPILSALYEQFGSGWLACDMGLPVHSQWYYFAITACKRRGDADMTEKIRVYLVSEATLHELPHEKDMNFRDSKSHAEAFHSLAAMARLLPANDAKEARGYKVHYQLRRIQLAMPIAFGPGAHAHRGRLRSIPSMSSLLSLEEMRENEARGDSFVDTGRPRSASTGNLASGAEPGSISPLLQAQLPPLPPPLHEEAQPQQQALAQQQQQAPSVLSAGVELALPVAGGDVGMRQRRR